MENFEEYLMQKYPDLFPKDAEGKTTYSSCGIGGYECWESIIEASCEAIDNYCKHSYRMTPTQKLWPRFKQSLYLGVGRKIYNPLFLLLDPYRGVIPKEAKKKSFYTIKPEWTKLAESRKRHKWQKALRSFYFSLQPKDYYEKVTPPRVTLAQLKTKFSSCRFYIDGGDEKVHSIVDFTEFLCDQISHGKLKIEKL